MIATDKQQKYIYLLEHADLRMTPNQLDRIVFNHNCGIPYQKIALAERIDPLEAVVALMHQTTTKGTYNRGEIELTRPFFINKKSESMDITEEHYKIAERNGIDRKNVYNRVHSLYWGIDRAITEPLNADLIDTEDEFFGGAG